MKGIYSISSLFIIWMMNVNLGCAEYLIEIQETEVPTQIPTFKPTHVPFQEANESLEELNSTDAEKDAAVENRCLQTALFILPFVLGIIEA
eukprot:snap_masked-scaffold_1-processed-gene-14.15-mRNA-1 protein AED:1.00 eAED:1.00 QI:0/-1/0/0/-1/1/1/0/90